MKIRSINQIVPSVDVNMGGFIVGQPLPSNGLDMIDPFLLVHHADHFYLGGEKQKDIGVGPHPHRGFSPVTFVFKGSVHHRDSMNNSSIIDAGGTQWMNSGKGVIHSERPTKETAEKGGPMEIIQFWVNTPSKHKMESPQYLPLQDVDTPRVENNDLVDVAIVAGEMNGVQGPLKGFSELIAVRNTFKSGGKYDFVIPENYNVLVYVLDGELEINGHVILAKNLAYLKNDGSFFSVEAQKDSRFIILAGVPLNEKVSSYGPFVMTSQSEILGALSDYQKGKMGFLVEEFEDN